MLSRVEYVYIKRDYSDKTFHQLDKDYDMYKKNKSKMDCDECLKPSAYCNTFPLAHCKTAVPCTGITYSDPYNVKEEGKTPMRYNDNYASATVIQTGESDSAKGREYLLNRLNAAWYPKTSQFDKLFNRYVDNTPKTYADMIAIIKAGTYTIDPKIEKAIAAIDEEEDSFHCGPLYGIIWPGPVYDQAGWLAAVEAAKKQKIAAMDAIMSGVYADGLAALQAFEAWLPTPATPAQ